MIRVPVRPQRFWPCECTQWPAPALGPFSEASSPNILVEIQTADTTVVVCVIFCAFSHHQPHSPRHEKIPHKIQQMCLLGKTRKIKEVAVLLTLCPCSFCLSQWSQVSNAEKVNDANGLVSAGMEVGCTGIGLRFHLL